MSKGGRLVTPIKSNGEPNGFTATGEAKGGILVTMIDDTGKEIDLPGGGGAVTSVNGQMNSSVDIPATPSPTVITFDNSDFANSNGYFEASGINGIKILKNAQYFLTVLLNVEKSGTGSTGNYKAGMQLNGVSTKGSWRTYKTSESGIGDIETVEYSGVANFTSGDVLTFVHYENGSGDITLINTAENYSIDVKIVKIADDSQ